MKPSVHKLVNPEKSMNKASKLKEKITSLRKVKIKLISILPIPGNGAKNLLRFKYLQAYGCDCSAKVYPSYKDWLLITNNSYLIS